MALVKIIERALKAGYDTERVERALSAFQVVPSLNQLEKQMKGIVFASKKPEQQMSEGARRAFAAAEQYRREQEAMRAEQGWDDYEG